MIRNICDISRLVMSRLAKLNRDTYVQVGIRPRRSCAAADMQIPPIFELEEAAKKLVWAAKKNGTLKFVHSMHSDILVNDYFS